MNVRKTVVLGVLAALPGLACAPVPGAGRYVHIDAEEAFIVWDELAKRQHFIRRASFDTNAKDFGFLVPTPGRPDLGESDDDTFSLLRTLTAPPIRASAVAGAKAARAPAAVTVLEQKVVAGFDAAVLQASDAGALDAWLRQHGYHSSPELLEWYKPYIADKWLITAFKVSGDSPRVATKAVRMSFQTERPFFPYREPAAKSEGGKPRERILRVYFLGHARYEGALGRKGAWPGEAVFANTINEEDRRALLKTAGLSAMAGGGGLWLTEFVDRSSPRPGRDEVYFARAADQSVVKPPPPREPIYIEEVIVLLLVVALILAPIIGGIYYYFRRR